MTAPTATAAAVSGFEQSRERFEVLLGFLDGYAATGMSHADLEERLQVDGRELMRGLFQDHLDVRADRERRIESVSDVDGVARGAVEAGHQRGLSSVFGELAVGRMAYRASGAANLHPADALLNLPVERHSHGLRRLAAVESSRGSFDDAVDAIQRATGQRIAKRQVEQLAGRAAVDFAAFYEQRDPAAAKDGDVLVISCDGKGVVMRHDALRPATAKAAANATTKLDASVRHLRHPESPPDRTPSSTGGLSRVYERAKPAKPIPTVNSTHTPAHAEIKRRSTADAGPSPEGRCSASHHTFACGP